MKYLDKLAPDVVCALIQHKIREILGDEVENKSSVYASHGYYYIELPDGVVCRDLNGAYRRNQLPAVFKEMRKCLV